MLPLIVHFVNGEQFRVVNPLKCLVASCCVNECEDVACCAAELLDVCSIRHVMTKRCEHNVNGDHICMAQFVPTSVGCVSMDDVDCGHDVVPFAL